MTTADYDALLDRVFDHEVARWTAEAEEAQSFPRQLIEYLGRSGVFSQKWGDQTQPDVAKLVALAFALGRLGSAGIGVGVSLHDSAIAILRRFGKSEYLRTICEAAINGDAVLCIGADWPCHAHRGRHTRRTHTPGVRRCCGDRDRT